MPPHLLIVNDDPDLLQMLQDTTTFSGYTSTTRRYPTNILADIKEVNPDLIILDWIFGLEELGEQALQALKSTPATAKIPVIVSTALSPDQMTHLDKWLTDPSIRALYKPFSLQALQDLLHLLLAP